MKLYVLTFLAILLGALGCKKDKKQSLAVVTTTSIASLTAASVQTGGTVSDDGGSVITKRGICWAMHAGPTVADSITTNGTGLGSFTTNLYGLSANTVYYIRAYAINAQGTAYGSEINFTTSAGLPTITTTVVSNLAPLSAKSGGNITNDGGAAVIARGAVWSTIANPTLTNFKSSDGTGTGTFTSTLSPLASQTTYYVRAYATNSYGTAYGNQVQFSAASANTVTDVEGNVYPYVIIGTQNWMATNLKVTKYKNGDAITNGYATTNYDWYNTTQGAYTFPNGVPGKKDSLGLYYNIYAINDSRGVCPTGWHLPTDDEWKTLETTLGMTTVEADGFGYRGTIASKLRDGGTSGMNLQTAGYLLPSDGMIYSYGTRGYFYTSTPQDPTNLNTSNWVRAITDAADANANAVRRVTTNYAMSVRCVKN